MDQWLGLCSCGDIGNAEKNVEKSKRKRNRDEANLPFVFASNDIDGVEKSLCFFVIKLWLQTNMHPSKLSRHFNTKHAKYYDKPIEHFESFQKSSANHQHYAKIFHCE